MKSKIVLAVFTTIILFFSTGNNSYCQSSNNAIEPYWMKYKAPLKLSLKNIWKYPTNSPAYSGNDQKMDLGETVNVNCGTDLGGYFSFPDFGIENAYSGDIAVTEEDIHGGEISISVDPNNKNILWESHMYRPYPGLQSALVIGNKSEYRGTVWEPYNNPALFSNCDPTSIVQQNGMLYVCFLTRLVNSYECSIHMANYDPINGWQSPLLIQEVGDECFFDKPHFAIDNTVPNGNFYCAWQSSFTGGSPPNCPNLGIQIVRSTDSGSVWEESQTISTDFPGVNGSETGHNGVNIQIGPGGEVYAVWACSDLTVMIGHDDVHNESGLVFVRSLDQGVSYQGDGGKEGYLFRPIHGIANYMTSQQWPPFSGNKWLNSFPSMCVDKSDGPHRGRIYIVWANNGPITQPDYIGDDIFTYVIYSDVSALPTPHLKPAGFYL